MGKKVLAAKSGRAVCPNAAAGGGIGAKNAKGAKTKPSGIPWIGDIPERWEIGRLKSVLIANDGGVWGDDPLDDDSDIIVLRSTEQSIDGRLIIEAPAKRQLLEGDKEKSLLKEGDLIITKSSGSQEHIGKTSIIDKTTASMRCCYSNFLQRLRVEGSSLFFWYVMNSYMVKMQFDYLATTTTGLKNLNAQIIGNLQISLPPLSEQRAIAAYLDDKCGAIDAAVAEAKKGIEEYKAWKKSLIFEVVTGRRRVGFFNAESQRRRVAESFSTGLTRFTGLGENLDNPVNPVKTKPSGVSWIGDVPEGWKVMKLRRLGIFANGISKGGEFFGKGSPFVSYSDVYKNEALPTVIKGRLHSTPEEQEKYSVKKGDVFFTRTSETIDEIGFASTCMENISQATFAGFLIRFRPTGSEILPSFSKYYFRNKLVSEYFAKELVMVTRASLGQELLKSLPVMLPPIPEQRAIVDYLDEKCSAIDAMIAEKEALIADLEAYKKSLIYEVVTGKRVVL